LGLTSSMSNWASDFYVIEGLAGSFIIGNDTNIGIVSNAYYDSNWKYKNGKKAADYYLYNGEHFWRTAISGATDSNISWIQSMKITNLGNILIGTNTEDINYK